MTNDLEKEIELAEDLKGKLDQIEGKKTSRRKKKVSQEVKSPSDADRQAVVGEMDDMKQKLVTLEQPEPVSIVDIPDPVKHKHISFVKSAFRILAGGALILVPMEMWTTVAGILLIIAEVLGIAEEMV